MPFLGNRDLTVAAQVSSTISARVFPELVTTTLYPNSFPTSPALAQKAGKSLPAGAIAGGVVAGAMLAVAVSIGWIIWGKSIKRTKDRQQREAVSIKDSRQCCLTYRAHHPGCPPCDKNKHTPQCVDTVHPSCIFLPTHKFSTTRETSDVCGQCREYKCIPNFANASDCCSDILHLYYAILVREKHFGAKAVKTIFSSVGQTYSQRGLC
jgi:hypothetical protein